MAPAGTDDPLSVTFGALADPTRRAILARLAEGDATVNELAALAPAISLQAVSKHLKVLERAGLVTRGRNLLSVWQSDNAARVRDGSVNVGAYGYARALLAHVKGRVCRTNTITSDRARTSPSEA